METEMVVKKGNTDGKAKNGGGGKANRGKGSDAIDSLVDKNGNMLPAESGVKREEKCQVKRQGLKTTINIETNRKVTKASPSLSEITSHVAIDGTLYELDDCVYIDSQRPDVPFFICAIKEFRVCKRECVYVSVKWFYRPAEVPESVYQLLVQDRNTENGSRDNVLGDASVKERELFVSDAVDTYSVSALRGKCKVKSLSEVSCLKDFISQSDHFFYVLRYNPETRRLANHKGEIRVGPSHQVLLPECRSKDEAKNEANDSGSLKEESIWRPTMNDYDLMMFVGAARSMAQYAGICKEGDTNKGLSAAARDATTINALNVLHDSKYDTAQALQTLVKRPFPKTSCMNWTDDESKKFVKGLRQFGKNFYKIRKELLPQKETGELVEYYYIWKKTSAALTSRPHRRRRHNVLRRRNLTRTAKSSSTEFVELSSCSEYEYDSEDSEKDLSMYCCRHCYSSDSKSWHHGGYDRVLLCTPCLTFFKKYGVMKKIEEVREPPPHMFKVVIEKETDEDYFVNGKQLRSRRSTPNISSNLRFGRNKACSPVDAVTSRESPIMGRKLTRLSKPASPSGASTGSNTSSSGSNKKSPVAKRRHTSRISDPSSENILPPKRKKSVSRESDEEETDQSERISSPPVEQEPVAMEGDAISVSSRTSTNEEAQSSPSPETLEFPEHTSSSGKFPARKVVVNGETCARAALPFTGNKKPEVTVQDNKLSNEKKSKEKNKENEDCSSEKVHKAEIRPPSIETTSAPAVVTSHYAEHQKYMAAAVGSYSRYGHGYPGMPVPGHPMMPMALPNHRDSPMMPCHVYSGLKDFRDAKDFDNWYAPYKFSRTRNNPNHSLPPSLLHSAPLMETQRNSPLYRGKDSMLVPGGINPLCTDPVTGLPHHHSHSHVHTHYHVHPGEQHANTPRSPSLGLEPNLMLRNPHVTPGHEMWLHPQAGLTGHPRHLMSPADAELNGIPPYFPGLYPPPSREYQLQQELMLSQCFKMEHGYPFYQPLASASKEHMMRFIRPHERHLRLETGEESPSSVSLMHRVESRSLRSPSIKNFEGASFLMSSAHKPETIDLSKDD